MTASGPTAAAAPGASALSTAAGQSPLPGAGSLRPLGAGSGAWVPTEAIACHRPVVPAVPRRKWLAMIPWLLEDQLLEPVERLHFACGERGADGAVAVLVVNSEQLVRWRRDAAGPLVPDGFALPWAQGECVLAVDGDRWRVRQGPWQLAAGPAALLAPLVSRLLEDSALELVVYGRPGTDVLPGDLARRARWRDPAGLFDRPREPFLALGDEPKERGEVPALPRHAWLAAGLAALAALLMAVGVGVETARIAAEADHIEGQLRAAHRRYLGQPYDFPMADFQGVVSRQLGAGEGGGALDLVAAVAPGVAACGACAIDRLVVAESGIEIAFGAPSQGDAVADLPRGGAGWRADLVEEGEGWRYRVAPAGESSGGLSHE